MLSVQSAHGLPCENTATDSYRSTFQLPQSPPPTPPYRSAAPLIAPTNDSITGRCNVPQCQIVSCRLISHAHFKQTATTRNYRHDISRLPLQRFRANKSTRISSGQGLSHSDLGQPLALHRFLTDMFEPALHNFRHAFAAILPAYTFNSHTPVLNSEPFCTALTLLACTNNAIAQQYYVELRTAVVLYTKALAGFRCMLASIQSSPDPEQIELALVIISILLSYDALYAKFHELKLHRHGMQKLVHLRGGLDYLTVSLPYVLHFDRISATMLNLSPAFSQQTSPELGSYRLSWPTHGAKFAQIRQQHRSPFTLRTLEHCERTSNLIRLCESLSRDQTPESENGLNNSYTHIEHFCSERDTVDQDFAAIHASTFDDHSIDKCILWTSRIVEYPVTWANSCPTYIGLLFEKLHDSIREPELQSQWSEHTDVLTWVLFVMAISLTSFEGRSEVVLCLQELIRNKYTTQVWPRDWWEEELMNLRGFVWCDNYFGQRYDALCRELEATFPL